MAEPHEIKGKPYSHTRFFILFYFYDALKRLWFSICLYWDSVFICSLSLNFYFYFLISKINFISCQSKRLIPSLFKLVPHECGEQYSIRDNAYSYLTVPFESQPGFPLKSEYEAWINVQRYCFPQVPIIRSQYSFLTTRYSYCIVLGTLVVGKQILNFEWWL